jgi:uroporphyrinogen decarboxylase
MDGAKEGKFMNPRERFLTTLDHREPDRVPLTTRLWLDTKVKLRDHFKAQSDQELYRKLGIDEDRALISVDPPIDWKPSPEYQEFCNAIGYEINDQYTSYEEWGIKRKLGSKRPGSMLRQFYFVHHPWEDFKEVSEVNNLELPDLDKPGRFDQAIQIVKDYNENRVIFGNLGHCQWTKAWELRGMITLMKDLHTNPKMAEAILDKLNAYYLKVIDTLLDIGAEAIRFSEDWGNNKSMFISPAMWRKFFKPRYKKLFNKAKKRGCFIFFHSDGNITPIVGDLVDIGIDILNPVQPECMDQIAVKEKYGDKITIDTGISVQKTLPFGTKEDVKKETLSALKHLAPGGGFVYGTSHYALYDVPIENIVTLYETCKKHGKYPIQIP